MPKFISDDEMVQLESDNPAPKNFISDADMEKLQATENTQGPQHVIPEEVKQTVSEGGYPAAIARKIGNAGTFGAYDELAGGLATIGHLPEIVQGKEKLGDAYEKERQRYEDLQKETSNQYPLTSLGTELAAGYRASSQVLDTAAPLVKAGLEQFATSPLPAKIAQATNVVGKGKNLVGKLAEKVSQVLPEVGEYLPEGIKRFAEGGSKAADVASAIAGRVATYKTPYLAPVQAVSDTAAVANMAQKGLAWALDNAPQKLGKFAPLLKEAAARGGSALATATFILQQSDPEFQEVMKGIQE